ncbi:hypothetical protein N0V82_004508 [Gnomoniopsis sp. IMI 355080]|nr:hypothetical protein N0V82_004508 [Gnomoniopsis sp. IMI 355080]
MSALRATLNRARPVAVNRYATTTLRPSAGSWQAQLPVVQGQRANYAIPPHDKKNDDLGGPYGQEPPNPEHRKKQNRGFAFQAAVVVGLGLGLVVTAGSFFSPRKIANYQIENDTVIGGPKSNTGGSLAAIKRKEGVKTSHELHHEQTNSSVLGNK